MGLEAVTHYLGEESEKSDGAFNEDHGRFGPGRSTIMGRSLPNLLTLARLNP